MNRQGRNGIGDDLQEFRDLKIQFDSFKRNRACFWFFRHPSSICRTQYIGAITVGGWEYEVAQFLSGFRRGVIAERKAQSADLSKLSEAMRRSNSFT